MMRRLKASRSASKSAARHGAFGVLVCALAILWLAPRTAFGSEERIYPTGTLSLDAFTNQNQLSPAIIGPTPKVASQPSADSTSTNDDTSDAEPVLTQLPQSLLDLSSNGDTAARKATLDEETLKEIKKKLELARYLRSTRQGQLAKPLFVELLGELSPKSIQQTALLELAALAQDENDLPRAQQIYSQFLLKWPEDLRIPEILLRQGRLFRRMALYNMALTKYYAVMTSALILKNDQLEYYSGLVHQAQLEIAETHFALGKYTEAADFFSRLMKQTNTVNKSEILYKLVRCHSALDQYSDAVADARDFLDHFPEAPEQPEVRFYLAEALKQMGRDTESLQQVLLLLQEQRTSTEDRPAVWAYWQQRAGNLIANNLYREGDYTKALDIYLNLAQLDISLSWQLPVKYQVGMTYERLWQPQKAIDTYNDILSHETEMGTNATPSLKTIFDMARWRANFVQWQSRAEAAVNELHQSAGTNTQLTAGLPSTATQSHE